MPHPLLDTFESSVARVPDRLAAADQSLMLDYRSLRAVAAGLAVQIAQRTDRPHVGILAPTSAACAAAILACWYAGRVPVPLNFLLAPRELGDILRDAAPDLVLTIDRFEPAVAAAGLRTLFLDGRTLAPPPPGRPVHAPQRGPQDTAVILYTSGTSAEPKGVCLSFENVARNVSACIEHARISPDQVFLSILPQFHCFGFTAMTAVPLLLGATVWYLPRFSPLAVVGTIQEKRVSVFMAVASMYAALLHLKNADPTALRSIYLAVSGGEPLSMQVADAFEQRFGVKLMEGYGMTETSPVVSLNVPWASRRASVGRPLPGVEVAVAGDDGLPPRTHGAQPPPDAHGEGELLIRGHCLMQGYHNKPEQTAAALRDGWLRSGDIGRVDADGFVYITGRAKEMMIIGGENVFPREIENVLTQHPAVAECAVIGVRDALRGELPVAFVIPKEGASPDETALREFCRDRLAGYKVPREIHFASDFPRSPTGKILKRALHGLA